MTVRRDERYRQLNDVVREFEDACAEPSVVPALEFFDLHALEIWFGTPPNRLREVLSDLVKRGAPPRSIVGGVYAFLLGDPIETPLLATRLGDAVLPETEMFVRMFEHRLGGRLREASAAAEELSRARVDLHAMFDRRGGWNLFLSTQLGTTAMLAGDLTQALVYFTEARLHPPAPILRFLLREALAKSALIEASEGDLAHAREHLDAARAIPDSTSWTEPGVAAAIAVAEALLAEDGDSANAILADIPAAQLGEIWPFYAVAVNRAYGNVQNYVAADRRLGLLDSMALPRTPGDGYSGSIIPILRASNALCLDNPRAAEQFIALADPALARTQLVRAQLSLSTGQPRRALQQVLEMPEENRELRQVGVWRHALLAAAHLQLDQPAECETVLQRALASVGEFTEQDVRQFEDGVRTFAAQRIEGWPATQRRGSSFARASAATGKNLTEREVQVLQLLTSGRSRDEIAAALFISVNTLKTQLRSVYRKLGVSQRSAAVLEAQRRGIV
ncbi:helix-turn-helix transcriptional regulator [Leucobacter chromiireducens]|uniref:helix-turn-helix transcriptional regulator n=1 Tax=Leucobacter chromiireducens TaxID=283877 RepID=UPI000F633A48|nr:LuxR C-terminal-related transcriptional regulator [Leucobacter chromiireducens]